MRNLALVILVIWIIGLWSVFVVIQQQPFLKENNLAGYLFGGLASIFTLAVACGIGLKMLGDPQPSATILTGALALGLAIIGMLTLLLAALGLLYSHTIWLMVIVLGIVGRRGILRAFRFGLKSLPSNIGLVDASLAGAIGFGLAICLINCLAPVTANDALVYHFNLPKVYLQAHHLGRLPFNVYANMPHNGEVLYTAVYAMAGESGAKIFYFLLIAATGLAIYGAARSYGTTAAIAVTSAFVVQPLIIDHRIVGNVDILLALFTLTTVVLLQMGDFVGPFRRFGIVGIMLGFMLGMKYTSLGIVAGIVVSAFLIDKLKRKHLVLSLLVAFLIFLPWLIKNQIYVDNPFYPMLEKAFNGLNWEEIQTQQLVRWQRSMGMGRSLTDYLALPFNIFVRGKPGLNYTRFDGTLSPILLIVLPLVFLRRKRHIYSTLIIAGIGFVFWALTSQQLRFLMPVLVLMALAGASGLENLSLQFGKKALSGFLVAIFAIEISSLILPNQYGNPIASSAFCDRLPVVMGLETRQKYLARTLQPYEIFKYIDSNIKPGEPILLIWENRTYYLNHPHFADSFFEASTLMRLVSSSSGVNDLTRRIKAMGFRYALVNNLLGQAFSRYYEPGSVNLLKKVITERMRPVRSLNKLTLYEISNEGY